MDYRILGPLEAFDGERPLPLGGARQRSVLAMLLLHANEAVTRDVMVDELWGESPPPTAPKVLQNCISALRKELPEGAETLRTMGTSYALELAPDELDRDRFEHALAKGRAALAGGDGEAAAEQLRAALGLWRGAPLCDFAYEHFAQDEIVRLEELHLAALEDRIEADLAAGRAEELVPELESLVGRHRVRSTGADAKRRPSRPTATRAKRFSASSGSSRPARYRSWRRRSSRRTRCSRSTRTGTHSPPRRGDTRRHHSSVARPRWRCSTPGSKTL